MMKDYEKRYARVLAAGKNMDAATVEYIGGIEVVKTFNQGERSYTKYADAVAENETAKATWFKQDVYKRQNQTLAMIALWAASVHLFRRKRNYWITVVPASFMLSLIHI